MAFNKLTSDSNIQTSDADATLMRRALELAACGIGQVSPSPLVGCVIVKDGEIVGEGFYLYDKLKHAEVIALEQAGDRARGATAYVSLEPHDHHGRTPPCTAALIRAGVKRVVAPIEDPNPLVAGKGFENLRRADLRVDVGLLAHDATRLNEKYIHFMRHARPFVHLKLACSLDGKIATRTGDAKWITNETSRARVHRLRHEYDAILVGARTVAMDDPLLTDRSDLPRHRKLVRVVPDENLSLSPESRLAETAGDFPTIVFASENVDAKLAAKLEARGVEIVRGVNARNLEAMFEELRRRSIISLLVEGGSQIAGVFIDARCVDKVSFFIAPLIIGGRAAFTSIGGAGAGKIVEAMKLGEIEITLHDDDIEVTGYPKSKAEGRRRKHEG